MTAPEDPADLVPLRTDFDLVWRGYDREQVRGYVAATEADLRLLATDRDAAVARAEKQAEQLNAARVQIRALHEKVDRICRSPIEPDALTERLRRMVELAHAEAEEITSRARTAAEHSWAAARDAADRLRHRQDQLVAELDRRRQQMETEHRQLMGRAQEQVESMTRQAEERRRDLDEQTTRLQEQVRIDFELAMTARRAEAMREIADKQATARSHAHRIVAEAQEEANQLMELRDRAAAALRGTHQLLTQADQLLAPAPSEAETKHHTTNAAHGSVRR